MGSITKEIPSATPARGVQPPNQWITGCACDCSSNTPQMTPVATVAPMASASEMRRCRNLFKAERMAATDKGITTGSGARVDISAFQGFQFVRIKSVGVFLELQGEREEQRNHGCFHHNIRQHQRLHHGINRGRAHLYSGK